MVVVDIHTHMYPPVYMELLRQRDAIPYVKSFAQEDTSYERLVILPAEDTASTSRGRPIGPEYYDIKEKIAFMNTHNIDISVISLANPWLDWVPPDQALNVAKRVNDDMEKMCADHHGRLYAFGTLPLSAPIEDIVAEVGRLSALDHHRGIIMGTSGIGQGLDDPRLDPIYTAIEEKQQLVFLHPHYGLANDVYGPRGGDYGHVLPLALGFPMETTIAVARMYLSGVWDRFPRLNVLIAHSGGTLPFLAGRIESCIAHDAHLLKISGSQTRRSIWDILKNNVYLDAVIYNAVGLKSAIEASGSDRLMFGTDHPFFPPLRDGEKEWLSVASNIRAIDSAFGNDSDAKQAVLGANALRVLHIAM